jgi:hypothetical protein
LDAENIVRDFKSRIRVGLSACLLLSLASAQAWGQAAVGNANIVVNEVTGAVAGASRVLSVEDDIFQDELIRTGASSATKLVFRDETTMEIGPESELTIDTFVFDPDPDRSRVVMALGKGAFRFVSGRTARANYEIRTPTAIIGIRGTILEIAVALNGSTTVTVVEGVVAVSNAAGVTQVVSQPGLSTTVNPAPPGGTPPPPSPPAPPPPAVQSQFAPMNSTLGSPGAGGAAGGGAAGGAGGAGGAGALGGITVGAVAAGAAVAAAVALAVSALTAAEISSVTSTTTTTSTSTSTATSTN